MEQAARIDTRRTFTIADLNTEIDGEPRINDLRLGEGLGFARPRVIRELVTRNKVELNTYGSLAVRHGKSRGQSFSEYYLNEGQALLICMFAKTVAAAAVRKALIDVFMEYRRGKIGKPVHVREHDRRTSTKIDDAIRLAHTADRLERLADTVAPKPQNVCAMIVDGEPVWVDINKYDGAGRAVVIEHDGRVRIHNVEKESAGHRPFGARTALGERFRSPHGGIARSSVAVVGMVIGTERPEVAKFGQTIEHEPQGRKGPFKDEILRLIPTGMSTAAITRQVGCSREAVQYWRRRVSA